MSLICGAKAGSTVGEMAVYKAYPCNFTKVKAKNRVMIEGLLGRIRLNPSFRWTTGWTDSERKTTESGKHRHPSRRIVHAAIISGR